MAQTSNYRQRVLGLVRKRGILRARELDAEGIPREYLRRLKAEGVLDQPGRGLYVLASHSPTENYSLAEIAKRVPSAIVCLLSALRFHELTTQAPFEIWIAIGEKARVPKIDTSPIRVMRFSKRALEYGVETHKADGVVIKVFSPAKTVADCFKYRNKVGLDVAIEALRDVRRTRKATVDQIWEAAKVCRVTNVMRPYLEAIS
jgi:predicted transcriptional regulator of viral defense system